MTGHITDKLNGILASGKQYNKTLTAIDGAFTQYVTSSTSGAQWASNVPKNVKVYKVGSFGPYPIERDSIFVTWSIGKMTGRRQYRLDNYIRNGILDCRLLESDINTILNVLRRGRIEDILYYLGCSGEKIQMQVG